MEGQSSSDPRNLMEKLRRVDLLTHRKLWQKLNIKEKPGHFMILARLRRAAAENPTGLRVSDLAAAFDITSPGVTQIVTALEKRGYVGRTMDPEDRRAVRVFLTETGIRKAESVMGSVDAISRASSSTWGTRKATSS